MTGLPRGLLDTSVFIAGETGRSIDLELLPDASALSVVTLAELTAGVLAARDTATRALRLATLERLASMELLSIDEAAASAWARFRVHLAEAGRRLNVNHVWIAATAVAHGIPLVTLDRDFDALAGQLGLTVIQL